MLKKIGSIVNRIVNFGNNLLSDSHSVSLKRFVSLLAFLLIMLIVLVAMKHNFTPDNVNLLNHIVQALTWIIGVGLFGIAATDIFGKRD